MSKNVTITNERSVDLAYEHHRYGDVRRWMTGFEALTDAEEGNVAGTINPGGTITGRTILFLCSRPERVIPGSICCPLNSMKSIGIARLVRNPLL